MKLKPKNKLFWRSLIWKKMLTSSTTRSLSLQRIVNLRKQLCNLIFSSWKNRKTKTKCTFRRWKKESRKKTRRLSSRKTSWLTCKKPTSMPWINTNRKSSHRNQCSTTRSLNLRSVLRKLKTHLWPTRRNWLNKSNLRHSRTRSLPTKYRNWKIQSSCCRVNRAKKLSKWANWRWMFLKNRRKSQIFRDCSIQSENNWLQFRKKKTIYRVIIVN